MKKITHKIFIISVLFLSIQKNTLAQQDSIQTIFLNPEGEQAIENLIQTTQNDNGFELNTTFEHLENTAKKKVNINKISKEDLAELGLLTPLQVEDFFSHKEKNGNLIALQELQSIPSFDLATIKKILPFVKVSGDIDDYQISFKKMFLTADNQLFVRTSTFLEPSAGQVSDKYLGNNLQHYIRYKRSFGTKFSLGFTLEKDRNEPYFYDKKIYGADFMSAHFAYKSSQGQYVVGDFVANFGQGLILFQDFAPGKSPFITDLKRQRKTIRPYTSVAEANFLRGVATTQDLGQHLSLTAFVSFRQRDAIFAGDTTQAFEEVFTSIGNTGLHRSEQEILGKNTIQNITSGMSLKWKNNRKYLTINGLYNRFDEDFVRDYKPYNQFAFRGQSLLNMSADYGAIVRNFNFFGETAMSQNGGLATINGLLVGLDKTLNMSILHRYYARDYQSLLANPVAENTGANNENGLYIGMSILPTNRWKIESYADFWRNAWLRFQVNAPANGAEFYQRVTYTIKRKLEFYVQYRYRTKARNLSEETILSKVGEEQRQQLRFNLQYQVSPEIEWESRVELSDVKGIQPRSQGFLMYQDLKFKPKGLPFSFTARYCLFDTDDYNSRIYAYENSLMYLYSIPPLSGKGSRYYFNLRWAVNKKMMLEARFAQTYLPQVQTIGSGNDKISANTKTELGVQLRYNF